MAISHPPGHQHSRLLQTALEAAKAAEGVIRHYYQQNVAVEMKEDYSPVTVADVECEKAIKQTIRNVFPDHGFYGEEEGFENADADYIWLIDPIDGTKSFVREYPFFSTQIALMHKKELILGVSNAPMFGPAGEMAYAEKGAGAFLNGKPITVSDIKEMRDATLSLGNIKTLSASNQWLAVAELIQATTRIRGYGDFYHYHLLASGKVDMVVESDVNILDIAALSVIIHEAGGQMTTMAGQPLTLETTTVVASNGHFQQAVLDKLAAS